MTNTDATTLIKLSDISLYLSKDELEQKKLYSWVDETKRCRLIYMLKKSLSWAQPYYVGNNSFDLVSNYLGMMIGNWKAQAQNILTLGSAGSIVNVVTGDAASIMAFNLQFTVGNGTMGEGDTTYVVEYPYIMKDSISVEMPQTNIPIADISQFSYQISYTDTNATITFLNGSPNIGVQNGMQFIIKGLRFISAQSSGGGGGSVTPTTDWKFETVLTTGQTFYIPELIGKTLNIVFRAAPIKVITFGTPLNNQVLWNSSSAILTAPASNVWISGEEVAIQYNL